MLFPTSFFKIILAILVSVHIDFRIILLQLQNILLGWWWVFFCLFIYLCYVWDIHSHYFFEHLFSPLPFLLSFLDTADTNMRPFFNILTGLWDSVHFFSLVSLFCSDWVISLVLSSRSLILSSLPSILLSNPSSELFTLVIYIFLYLFFSLLTLSVSLLRLSIFFTCLKYAHTCLLKHFYHCCFKICQIILTSLSSRFWCLWIVFFHCLKPSGSWYNEWFFYWGLCVFILCFKTPDSI